MANLREKAQKHQKMLRDSDLKQSLPGEYNEYGVHLWVLVHGFQGNS